MSEGFYVINRIYAVNVSHNYGIEVYPDEFSSLSAAISAANRRISDPTEARYAVKALTKKELIKWYRSKMEYIDLIDKERKAIHPRATKVVAISKSYEYQGTTDIITDADYISAHPAFRTTDTVARKIEKMWESF